MKNNPLRGVRALLLASAAAGSAGVHAAWAQETTGSPAPESQGAQADSETVVVTAQRREQQLVNVPASISVVTSADIRDKTLIALSDLSARVPNVLISGSSLFPSVTIRGMSSPSGISPGFAPAAVVYVDEIYQGRDRTMNLPLSGIKQIEVLRGPQGTLYGKNTIAGAINITTVRPGDQFEAEGAALLGNLDFAQFTGTVSGPLVDDKVAAALSGFYRHRDGYIHNAYDDSDLNFDEAYGGRLRVVFTPTSKLSIDVSADYMNERNSETLLTTDYSTIALLPFPPYSTTPVFDPRTRTVALNSPDRGRREVYGFGLRFDYDFDTMRFTSISALRGYTSNHTFDSDGTSLKGVAQTATDDLEQFSQELRVTSTGDGPFQWIVGAFYYHERFDSVRRSTFLEDFPGFLLGLPFFPPGYADTAVADARISEESAAFFVSASYDITESLRLSGGMRYTADNKRLDFSQLEETPVTPSIIQRLLSIIPPRVERISESEPSFDLSLSYAFMPDQVGYLRFSRGYKAGGFNAVLITPPFSPSDRLAFNAEFVNNYEAGFKGSWFDGGLSLNAAVFYMDYQDKQEMVQNLETLGFAVRNAASAEVYGAEFEVTARPFDGLTLEGTLALLHGVYEDFPNAGPGGLNFTGNRLARAPDWQGSFAIQYEDEIPGWSGITGLARIEVTHTDSYFHDPNNTPRWEADPVTYLNGRIGLQGENWGLYLWGKNLTDEFLLSNGTELVVTRARAVNMPRTYGVELNFRY